MSFLRTASTRRLLAAVAGVVVAAGGGAAIAVAATGSGPVPPKESLAKAVHGALSAPQVQGVSARITLTNHLIDASSLETHDPLLTGAGGRVWISNSGQVRLELQADNGQDAEAVLDNGSFWVYDPSSNTVYKGNIPAGSEPATKKKGAAAKGHHGFPSVAQIQRELGQLAQHLNIAGPAPGDIAGEPEYTVRVSPKQNGGLIGAAETAWDAVKGVPLRFAVYAKGDPTPVLDLSASQISFGPVAASTFAITPPSGATIVPVQLPQNNGKAAGHKKQVSGLAAVAKAVSFKLDAPDSLAGMPRNTVQLLGSGAHAGALVTYGQGLGGIAVMEHGAKASGAGGQSSSAGQPGGGQGLNLPTVSLHGVTATELPTALGTVLTFTRGGVDYTLLGSVPAGTTQAAAAGL